MGSFSWQFADRTAKTKNIAGDKPFKFLIPKHLGGGCIKDHYQDYGYLGTKSDNISPKYDMYELIAIMNKNMRLEDLINKLAAEVKAAERSPRQKAYNDVLKHCSDILEAISKIGSDTKTASCVNYSIDGDAWYETADPEAAAIMKDCLSDCPKQSPAILAISDAKIKCCMLKEQDMANQLGFSPSKLYMYRDERKANPDLTIGDLLKGDISGLKEIDDYTNDNRSVGIDIACYEGTHKYLDYPLKLAHVSYKGNYESLNDFSPGDPEQGFCQTYFSADEITKWKKANGYM